MGAYPSTGMPPGPGYRDPFGPEPKKTNWALVVGIGAVTLIVMIVAVGVLGTLASSQSTSMANDVVPLDAAFGECFTSEGDLVRCTEPHRFEVFDLWEFYQDAERPGRMDELYGTGACVENFTDYTGDNYYTSKYEIAEVWPSELQWADGDRRLVCALYDTTSPTSVGSARSF